MRDKNEVAERQALLVLSTYSKVADDEGLVTLFWEEFARKDERFQALIPKSYSVRKGYLNRLLKIVIKSVYCLESMRPELEVVVREGFSLGLKEHDFALIAQALIRAIEGRMGNQFHDEAKNAWLNVCQQIIVVINEGIDWGAGPAKARLGSASKL